MADPLGSGSMALYATVLIWPLLALAGSRWRGDATHWRHLPGLVLLWALTLATLVALVYWPLPTLRHDGSLVAALALSGALGLAWLGLWRTWPLFAWSPALGLGRSIELWRGRSDDGLAGALAGLGLLATAASLLSLFWPGLLPAAASWPVLLAHSALALLMGLILPRPAPRAGATREDARLLELPVVELATAAAASPAGTSIEADESGAPDRGVALYRATRNGHIEQALALLEAGADPQALPLPGERDQRTLPMLAALLGDLRLLRALIARGVDLNAAHAGLAPLLAATRDSWHGRPEAVMTLLANGADPRRADGEGYTPLHHAARSTDPAVAALLLDAGAQVDALADDGVSPLGMACAVGNWRLARYLLEHGGKAEPNEGQPALLAAAGGEDEPIGVQLLLKHKAKVDSPGVQGRTALLQACQAGNGEVVAALLDAGADANRADHAGITPLLEAARSNQQAALEHLLAARSDPNACDVLGRNALVLACEAGASAELIEALLAAGVDPEQADAQGRRALDLAVAAGRWPLVARLDPDYPLPASMRESGEALVEKAPRALLREALQANRRESAESLRKLGAWPEPEALAGLLLEFAEEPDGDRLRWLVAHGASADQPCEGGESVMRRLLARGPTAERALGHLLDAGCAVSGRGSLARYLGACLHRGGGSEARARILLERGADPFGEDGDAPPLLLAVRLGWTGLLRALLDGGADPSARDGRGHTALHHAAMRGDVPAIQALLAKGARPELAGSDGQTALGLALAAGRGDAAPWLDWRTWTLPGRPLWPSDLPAAAMAGDAEAVRRLLALGLPVNALDAQGCSALLRAAGGGSVDAVAVLLAAGADTGIAARTGATALSAAISMRHAEVVERLLAAGAVPDQALPGGITPLMLAAALGQPDLVDTLLAHAADPFALDDQGQNALHCACLHAFGSRDRQRSLSLINALLAARLPVGQATTAGNTPLLMLLGARADAGATCDEEVVLAVLERLLTAQADVNAQDQRGLAPLHLAAMHGLSRAVQRLLREGAERNVRDSLGRSPHDLAVQRGYVDVAAEFEPPRPAPSLARFLRNPPPGP